jgi:hypothetical protein
LQQVPEAKPQEISSAAPFFQVPVQPLLSKPTTEVPGKPLSTDFSRKSSSLVPIAASSLASASTYASTTLLPSMVLSRQTSSISSRPSTAQQSTSAAKDDFEASKKALSEEKRETKKLIVAWNKDFEIANKREATRQERQESIGELYRKYNQVGFHFIHDFTC